MNNEQTRESFPLSWPTGYRRTTRRIGSKFAQSMDKAQRFLRDEVSRLGGRNLIVSTNLRLRNDGGIYAADMNKLIDDPGVAIYFKYKGKDISMCCDQYLRVWENIYALAKGIEALRGMERWGVSDFLDRAFTGFTALPESTSTKSWSDILGVPINASADQIKEAYRRLAMVHHPDKGGDANEFTRIKSAYEIAMNQQ